MALGLQRHGTFGIHAHVFRMGAEAVVLGEAEYAVTDGEALHAGAQGGHRTGVFATRPRALRTQEPRVRPHDQGLAGAEAAVGAVHGGGMHLHQQLACTRCGHGHVHQMHHLRRPVGCMHGGAHGGGEGGRCGHVWKVARNKVTMPRTAMELRNNGERRGWTACTGLPGPCSSSRVLKAMRTLLFLLFLAPAAVQAQPALPDIRITVMAHLHQHLAASAHTPVILGAAPARGAWCARPCAWRCCYGTARPESHACGVSWPPVGCGRPMPCRSQYPLHWRHVR